MYHVHSHGVSGLFVGLGIRVHREELVDLCLIKTLESETLPRHQAADASASGQHTLGAAGV